MVTKLEDARFQELDPEDIRLLWRFTAAHRSQDPIQSWQELRDLGLEKVEDESLLDLIKDQLEFAKETH